MLVRTGGRFSRFRLPRRRFGSAAVQSVRIVIEPCDVDFDDDVKGEFVHQVLVAEITRKAAETVKRLRGD